MPASFSQQEIADILRHEERHTARPQPVTLGSVGAQVAQALVAGMGAALLLGGGAMVLGAPSGIAMQIGLTTGVLAAGIGLMLRIIPDNKLATVQRMRRVQRTVIEAEFRKQQAYKAIEDLEERFEARTTELQRALDRMTLERDSAILEKKRALEQAQAANNRNFVRASNTDAQVMADAHEILRFWSESNGEKWLSRNAANSFGWSDKRHRAAQKLLVDSGVVVINEKRPRVMESTLDAALRMLNNYVARVDSVYVPDARSSTWEDAEDA